MKKVVCIGGGTGQSALLRGLKQIEDIDLSAVVAVSDNGGSTGILINELNIPAMGDVRNVLTALAEKEDAMTRLLDYRFDTKSGRLSGHSLGNIIISAMIKDSHDFLTAVQNLSATLKIRAKVLPCSDQMLTLSAHMTNGQIVDGETQIRDSGLNVRDVFYKTEAHSYPEVVSAIMEADYIIIGIGSLYTSILPNLIIPEIREALLKCQGKVVYYCNCMSEPGETDGYSLEDHIRAIEEHLGEDVIDAVICANDTIPDDCLENYRLTQAYPVEIKEQTHDYRIFGYPLLRFDHGVIRHDSDKVRDSFADLLRKDEYVVYFGS